MTRKKKDKKDDGKEKLIAVGKALSDEGFSFMLYHKDYGSIVSVQDKTERLALIDMGETEKLYIEKIREENVEKFCEKNMGNVDDNKKMNYFG